MFIFSTIDNFIKNKKKFMKIAEEIPQIEEQGQDFETPQVLDEKEREKMLKEIIGIQKRIEEFVGDTNSLEQKFIMPNHLILSINDSLPTIINAYQIFQNDSAVLEYLVANGTNLPGLYDFANYFPTALSRGGKLSWGTQFQKEDLRNLDRMLVDLEVIMQNEE